jgi:hypothetical protein
MYADYFIQRFHLVPHPEGGYYSRTHMHEDGSFSSILFLLTRGNFSAFHRIRADEQWNWYYGDDIIIHEIDLNGNYQPVILSNNTGTENFQYVVKGGHWFASECVGKNGFAFCGCTVIPAFRFEDFELGNREELIRQFPQHQPMITKLTRI